MQGIRHSECLQSFSSTVPVVQLDLYSMIIYPIKQPIGKAQLYCIAPDLPCFHGRNAVNLETLGKPKSKSFDFRFCQDCHSIHFDLQPPQKKNIEKIRKILYRNGNKWYVLK